MKKLDKVKDYIKLSDQNRQMKEDKKKILGCLKKLEQPWTIIEINHAVEVCKLKSASIIMDLQNGDSRALIKTASVSDKVPIEKIIALIHSNIDSCNYQYFNGRFSNPKPTQKI